MLMSCRRNTGHEHSIKVAYKFFRKQGKIQIFGKDSDKNYIRRLNSRILATIKFRIWHYMKT